MADMEQNDLAVLRAIVDVQNEIVAASLDLHAVMDLVVNRTRALTDAAAGVIEIADGPEMVYEAVSGAATDHLGLRLNIMSSLSGLSVRSGEILRCDDSETDPRVDRDACLRVGARSMLCVPLRHQDEPVGVLKVYSPEPHHFDSRSQQILELMVTVIAAAMANAATYELRTAQALHDAHTQLANRILFNDRLELALGGIARGTEPSVLLLDLDGFKAVNDTLGHGTGDKVLREVADTLRANVRQTDTAARLGGDEFGVLCVPSNQRISTEIAGRLVDRIGELSYDGLRIGASIGVVHVTTRTNAETVLEQADRAMYAAKRSGKSRFVAETV
ncbi:MAG: diguanylate cyclase domain-containing protein [Actinomycetota bacterium]